MLQSSASRSLLSPSDVKPEVGNVPPPPPLPGEGSRKSLRRSMGLPPLSPAGGDTARATRFITLEERLAEHVHATTPRVTPGRTREFDTAPPPHMPPRKSAAEEQKDDVPPVRQAGA